MRYHVAICDDCKEDRDRLKRLLLEFRSEYVDFVIYEFRSGEELLSAKNLTLHGLFLDIQMKKLDGQETAKIIRTTDQHLVLAFYTGVMEPSTENIKVQPYRYLVKNNTDDILRTDITEVVNFMVSKSEQPTLWVQVGIISINVQLDDILYIEKHKRGNCQVRTTEEFIRKLGMSKKTAQFVYTGTLDSVYQSIKEYGFEYAHSSYIVNFQHVTRYTRTEIMMKESITLALTRSKVAQFRERMKEYVLFMVGIDETEE